MPKRKIVSVYLPEDLHRALKAAAARLGVTLSSYVEAACKKRLGKRR